MRCSPLHIPFLRKPGTDVAEALDGAVATSADMLTEKSATGFWCFNCTGCSEILGLVEGRISGEGLLALAIGR